MQLAVQYMPLAESMACRRAKSLPFNVTLDELKSAAYLALAESASRYDPSVGVSFPAYARARIEGEISDAIRSRSFCEAEEVEVEAREERDGLETEDFFDFVSSEVGEEDGKTLRMYYVDGRSLKEVGRSRGVSESRASQILKDCHERLRRSFRRRATR